MTLTTLQKAAYKAQKDCEIAQTEAFVSEKIRKEAKRKSREIKAAYLRAKKETKLAKKRAKAARKEAARTMKAFEALRVQFLKATKKARKKAKRNTRTQLSPETRKSPTKPRPKPRAALVSKAQVKVVNSADKKSAVVPVRGTDHSPKLTGPPALPVRPATVRPAGS